MGSVWPETFLLECFRAWRTIGELCRANVSIIPKGKTNEFVHVTALCLDICIVRQTNHRPHFPDRFLPLSPHSYMCKNPLLLNYTKRK